MTKIEMFRREMATRVLYNGMAIWDRFKDSPARKSRQIALREQAKALINHDRILTDSRGAV